MSFSLTVPRFEDFDEFANAVYDTEASPKADARTKTGKRQKDLVSVAKDALCDLAYTFDPPYSATISGHVNPDLSGNVSINLTLLA